MERLSLITVVAHSPLAETYQPSWCSRRVSSQRHCTLILSYYVLRMHVLECGEKEDFEVGDLRCKSSEATKRLGVFR